MDNTTLLAICAFGCVGCISFFLWAMLNNGKEEKIRSRLKGTPVEAAPRAGGQPATSLMSQIGQAAAGPFMPTKREKISSTRRNLGFAGIYNPSAVKTLYGFKFIFLILGFVLGYVGSSITGSPMLSLPLGALVGMFAPVLWLRSRVKKNQKALEYGLADAMDLMVVCVEAGLTVDASMQRVGQELALVHPALSREMGITHMETLVGLSRSEALRNLGNRTGSPPLASLSSMLIQAERFGTSIAQALRVHGESLRLARQHKAEEMAAKSSVKMSFPLVLFIFPATFIVLAGPTVIELMKSPLMK